VAVTPPIEGLLAPLSACFLQRSLTVCSSALFSPLFLLVGANTLNGVLTLFAITLLVSFAIVLIVYYTILKDVKGERKASGFTDSWGCEDFTALGLRR
jgi:hypothetical protein